MLRPEVKLALFFTLIFGPIWLSHVGLLTNLA